MDTAKIRIERNGDAPAEELRLAPNISQAKALFGDHRKGKIEAIGARPWSWNPVTKQVRQTVHP